MKIIYTAETGLVVIHPADESNIEEVFNKDVPEQYKHSAHIVEDDVIPTDRTFRNAWKHEEGKIVEDLDLSKEIHKTRLRAQRKPMLEALDAEEMKDLREKKDPASIHLEKQRLCDITADVESCECVEDIKKILL